MKNIISDIRHTIVVTIIGVIILCGVYPVVVWGLGQTLFHYQANGSLITGKDGTVYGSELIGQNFSDNQYFNSRPSAAGTGYDASNSSATNLGPTSRKLHDSIAAAVAAYRKQNGLSADQLVPADAVTALVQKYTEGRDFGIFGEARVNVLKLNLALDGKI